MIVHGFVISASKDDGKAMNLPMKLSADPDDEPEVVVKRYVNRLTMLTNRNTTVLIKINLERIFLPRNACFSISPVFLCGC